MEKIQALSVDVVELEVTSGRTASAANAMTPEKWGADREVRILFPENHGRIARLSLIDESGDKYLRMANLAPPPNL